MVASGVRALVSAFPYIGAGTDRSNVGSLDARVKGAIRNMTCHWESPCKWGHPLAQRFAGVTPFMWQASYCAGGTVWYPTNPCADL